MAGTSISRSPENYLDHQGVAWPDQASSLPYITALHHMLFISPQWYVSTAELLSAYQQQM